MNLHSEFSNTLFCKTNIPNINTAIKAGTETIMSRQNCNGLLKECISGVDEVFITECSGVYMTFEQKMENLIHFYKSKSNPNATEQAVERNLQTHEKSLQEGHANIELMHANIEPIHANIEPIHGNIEANTKDKLQSNVCRELQKLLNQKNKKQKL